ncbi:MAG TPA: hypothetical protein VGG46_14890 [Terriglobales bacterium]|jgi:hypothetical protein
MRHLFAVIIAVLGLGLIASAQVPTGGNIFIGYSYFNADTNVSNRTNLNGWNGSLEGKVFPFVGIVADVGGYYGHEDFPGACGGVGCTYNAKVLTAMFGPRVSFSVGKLRPFANVLVGAGHTSGTLSGLSGASSDTSLADAFGGGIDYHLIPLIAWRVQADEVQTRFFSGTQNNFRLSTGIVFHF